MTSADDDDDEGLLDDDTGALPVADVESDEEEYAGSLFNDEEFSKAMSKIPIDLMPEAIHSPNDFFAKLTEVVVGAMVAARCIIHREHLSDLKEEKGRF